MKVVESKLVLELLTKTLEFYAQETNYKRRTTDNDTDTVSYLPSEIDRDKGNKAQETLRNIRELLSKEF